MFCFGNSSKLTLYEYMSHSRAGKLLGLLSLLIPQGKVSALSALSQPHDAGQSDVIGTQFITVGGCLDRLSDMV